MKQELEENLTKKYPDLFKNRNKSPKETLICFGCECGDGWYKILDNLCGYIENLQKTRRSMLKLKEEFKTEKNKGYVEFHCPPVVFDQIKEKYGTLRVYWHFDTPNYEELSSKLVDPTELQTKTNNYSDTIENAVEFSEYLSSITCEITGKKGKLYSDGWCVTLCKEEAIKRFGFDPDDTEDIKGVE
jgi:hypothetical protein